MNCPRWEKPVWITQIQAPTGRGQWHPTPVLLPGKSHGQRSLVGCSPWGHTESDTTERLHFGFSLSCTGEGHGNPLQCSCLEDPRDRGAWWAAIYRVAQSQTQLKWLNSSSNNRDITRWSGMRPKWAMVSTPSWQVHNRHLSQLKLCIALNFSCGSDINTSGSSFTLRLKKKKRSQGLQFCHPFPLILDPVLTSGRMVLNGSYHLPRLRSVLGFVFKYSEALEHRSQ